MNWLSVLLFSISVTCDGFIIGLSYGLKNVRISLLNNVVVGLISCLGTMGGMWLGQVMYTILSVELTRKLGGLLLILFGCWMFSQSLRKYYKEEDSKVLRSTVNMAETFDKDNSKVIELKEAIVLGLFLCVNNFGLGVGAALMGLNILVTSFMCFILSVIFIRLGTQFAKRILSANLVKNSEFIASLLIIILGMSQLLI